MMSISDYVSKNIGGIDNDNDHSNYSKVTFVALGQEYKYNIAKTISKFFIGSNEFSDGYSYEIPVDIFEDNDLEDNDQDVSKIVDDFVKSLVSILVPYARIKPGWVYIKAPMFAFLDKYIKINNDHLRKIVDNKSIYGHVLYDYGAIHAYRHNGYTKQYCINITTKAFNNAFKVVFPNHVRFHEQCSWDINNQHKYTLKKSEFFRVLEKEFTENIYEIVFMVHQKLFDEEYHKEDLEMFSYMIMNKLVREWI